jgi:predicted naringenin-chalcone synthase
MNRYTADAVPLALAACRQALANATLQGGAITHLVTVSCTGFSSPGVEFSLIRELGLPPTVGRVNVGFMGCHGALNGLRVLKAFGDADASAKPLLCSVELCSLHYQYGSKPQQLVANALFSDGAAALVAFDDEASPDAGWKIQSTGSCFIPDAEDAMTWRIGDHGFEMTLSPNVPDLIARYLRPWITTWLRSHGLTLEAVRSWAIHPGGPRILQSVQSALGLTANATKASSEVLRNHGNMSSATTLFVIERLQQSQGSLPCVALGFGPGLVCEAALFV